ncbi:MAG: Na+/H+ antiporter subunit E, partial [Burkholderiales bacterium]
MKRILPFPVLSVGLLLMWVLLQGSAEPLILLSGVVIALVAPFTLVALEMSPMKFRRPGAVFRLAGVVLVDVVRSNIAVASIIFGHNSAKRASGFLTISLDMRNRHGLAILSAIITCTPGTLWVQYD